MKIYLAYLLLITKAVYASSWPTFAPPDVHLLSALNYIDTHSCKPGEGKLIDQASLNISTYLCKNFCPRVWYWVTSSDNECHDLATDFDWQGNEIVHINGSDGVISYSQISIYYGRKNHPRSDNKIIFTSTPNDHWFCIEIPEYNSFTCANDL